MEENQIEGMVKAELELEEDSRSVRIGDCLLVI
jgi:hypothetical protein